MKGLIVLELDILDNNKYHTIYNKKISNKIARKNTHLLISNNINKEGVIIPYTYDTIIDILIKAQKLRYQYPDMYISCKFNSRINSVIYAILERIYDDIIIENKSKQITKNNQDNQTNEYGIMKHMLASNIGIEDSQFDNDYEYYQIKKSLGPIYENHFMFKEHDIEIEQNERFDFKKNKIKYDNKFDDPKLSIICELYEIKNENDCKKIRHNQLDYFHTRKGISYIPFNIYAMFDNITEFDYIAPLKKLIAYYSENNYYQRLYERNKYIFNDDIIKSKIRINLLDQISAKDRDSIITQYIKCRPNTFIITLWQPAIQYLDKFVELLEQHGNVYYIKTIMFSKKGLKNLLYWFYNDISLLQCLKRIEIKLNNINATEQNNPVCFIVFDNIYNKPLAGLDITFKCELINYLLAMNDNNNKCDNNNIDDIDNNNIDYRNNNLLHINDYFYQTVEYSQIIFNENSLNVLANQEINNFSNDDFSLAFLKTQTFRKIIYTDLSLLEADGILVIGDSVFYAYGIRSFNNINLLINKTKPNNSVKFMKYIETTFINKYSKFYYFNVDNMNNINKKKERKIIEFMHIKDLNDLILDPDNFFYHNGIKMVILEHEIIRKIIRNNINDYVDFLILYLLYPQIFGDYVSLTNKYKLSDESSDKVSDEASDKLSDKSPDKASDKTASNSLDKSSENTNDFYVISNKYSTLKENNNNNNEDKKSNFTYDILKNIYSNEQIDKIKNMQIFKDFFERHSI